MFPPSVICHRKSYKLRLLRYGLFVGSEACQPRRTGRILIRAGKVLDVKTGDEVAGKTIIVTGDKIMAIADTSSTTAAAADAVIDLTKYTLMPGLIDVHTHLTMANNFDPFYEVTMTPGKEAIIGVENAKVTSRRGLQRCGT